MRARKPGGSPSVVGQSALTAFPFSYTKTISI